MTKLADYGVDAFQLTEENLQQDLASTRVQQDLLHFPQGLQVRIAI